MWKEPTEQSYVNFSGSIKSEYTKKSYVSAILKFMSFCGLTQWDEMLRIGVPAKTKKVDSEKRRAELQSKISGFIQSEKKRGLRAQSLQVAITALWHFYEYNDITNLNWTKLRSYCGEHVRVVKDRGYELAEIRKILAHCDVRMKVLILLLATTGMRIGATPSLKLRNLEKIDGIYKVVVYENTSSEYWTLTTPETARAIDGYLEFRKRAGEELRPDNPLIREQFNPAEANSPRHVSLWNLNSTVRKLLIRAGVRDKGNGDIHKRHDVMLNHGMRKFWNTRMIEAGVQPLAKEILIGHKAFGLESNYYRPSDNDLIKEYTKAIPLLSIMTEDKLQSEVEELKKKLSTETQIMAKIKELSESSSKALARGNKIEELLTRMAAGEQIDVQKALSELNKAPLK